MFGTMEEVHDRPRRIGGITLEIFNVDCFIEEATTAILFTVTDADTTATADERIVAQKHGGRLGRFAGFDVIDVTRNVDVSGTRFHTRCGHERVVIVMTKVCRMGFGNFFTAVLQSTQQGFGRSLTDTAKTRQLHLTSNFFDHVPVDFLGFALNGFF